VLLATTSIGAATWPAWRSPARPGWSRWAPSWT